MQREGWRSSLSWRPGSSALTQQGAHTQHSSSRCRNRSGGSVNGENRKDVCHHQNESLDFVYPHTQPAWPACTEQPYVAAPRPGGETLKACATARAETGVKLASLTMPAGPAASWRGLYKKQTPLKLVPFLPQDNTTAEDGIHVVSSSSSSTSRSTSTSRANAELGRLLGLDFPTFLSFVLEDESLGKFVDTFLRSVGDIYFVYCCCTWLTTRLGYHSPPLKPYRRPISNKPRSLLRKTSKKRVGVPISISPI